MNVRFQVGFALFFSFTTPALAYDQARTNPPIQLFQGDGTTFELRGDMAYFIKRSGRAVLVPAGFVTDFASVPWFAQSIISVLGRHSVPAILHDYLYWQQKCTREEADLILFDAMDEYHSSWFRKHAVYYAVRLFGGSAWADNAADRKKGLIRILPPDRRELPENLEWETYRQGLLNEHVNEGRDPTSEGVDHPDYCSLRNGG